jgi:hypothetical protein
MSTVVIGIDPHKASHTAVAVDEHEHPLGQLRVRASAVQVEQLLDWGRQWPQHSWAVEIRQRAGVSAGSTAGRRR